MALLILQCEECGREVLARVKPTGEYPDPLPDSTYRPHDPWTGEWLPWAIKDLVCGGGVLVVSHRGN